MRSTPLPPRGRATLAVSPVASESAVTTALATSPLKLLIPRPRGTSVAAFTSNFGGGMVAGDTTRLDIRLGEGARCILGTQASSKIYRNPLGRPCGHTTVAHLGPRSLLVMVPDAVQAFADSSYHQRQSFHLGSDAGVVLLDWMSAGRPACGERWAFRAFLSQNEVFLQDRLVFLDSLRLASSDGPIQAPFRTGRFNCLAMLALLGGPLRGIGIRLAEKLASDPVATSARLIWSASPHPHGAILRAAAEDVESVQDWLKPHLQLLEPLLGEAPWSRRW